MNPALLFLLRRSAANALRTKLRRLKSPRYLVPTLLGAVYFFVLLDPFSFRGRGLHAPRDPGGAVLLEWGLAAGILLMASLSWILPVRGVPLAFLEPEVALLFPAPVTRKDLVRYKLLELQKYLLFIPVFIGLMNLGNMGPLRAAFLAIGSWLGLTALTLHGIGAKMTRLSLAEHGWSGVRRSLVPLLVVAAYLGFVVLTLPAFPGPREGGRWQEQVTAWLGTLGESPAGWALLPIRLLVRPFFAEGPAEFALRAAGLAAMVALLCAWVLRTDVAFEEAAAAQAETLARRIEDAKKGRITSPDPGKAARRNPFPLSPSGIPETAFIWKSVAELVRGLSPRLLIFLFTGAAIAIPIALGEVRTRGDVGEVILAAAAACMAMLAGLLVLLGPAMVGVNLRHDMERVEILKTFPLSGSRLVRCSLAGTLAPVAAFQAVLVLGAVLLFPSLPKAEIPPAWRLAAAVLGIAGLPAITAISAAVDAALVLYFPSWVKPGQPVAQGGMEGMGYGMLSGIVKMAALLVGLLPALPGILLGVLGAKVAGPLYGPALAIAGGLLGAALVFGEVWLLTLLLGRRFERFDPAEEGLVA